MSALASVRAALAGKRLLVFGASGFLGKVWLAHLLEALPELGRLDVVLRAGRGADPEAAANSRWLRLLETSPAFWPLHERHGEALGAALAGRVRILPGDVAVPGCGLEPAAVADVDLVVNLAGVTGLDAELEPALSVNTEGARHALEVARAAGARLLHVSTAYAAGRRLGRVPEALEPDYAPRRLEDPAAPFAAARERADLQALIARCRAGAHDQQVEDVLRARALAAMRARGRSDAPAALAERFLQRERERWARAELRAAARERARHWGWPNAYTLTKSLGESLLASERGEVPLAVVRPTIVESALAFPFAGWKEGLQTSAPITYAITHGPVRGLLARPDLVLDVIPVDLVARALTLVAAALASGAHDAAPGAYHVGSSHVNPFPMWRVIELTDLAHRRLHKESGVRGRLLPGPVASGELAYRAASLPLLRRLARGGRAALDGLASGPLAGLANGPLGEALGGALRERVLEPARAGARRAAALDEELARLEAMVELFRPFVHDQAQVFEADALARAQAALPPDERAAFGVDPAALDWRRYWLEVHIPGLERWIYPRLRGERIDPGPRRRVSLPSPAAARRLEVSS